MNTSTASEVHFVKLSGAAYQNSWTNTAQGWVQSQTMVQPSATVTVSLPQVLGPEPPDLEQAERMIELLLKMRRKLTAP